MTPTRVRSRTSSSYDGDEVIFDGSDPSAYIVSHTAEDMRRALEGTLVGHDDASRR